MGWFAVLYRWPPSYPLLCMICTCTYVGGKAPLGPAPGHTRHLKPPHQTRHTLTKNPKNTKQIQETDDGATAAEAGRIPRTVEVELREDLVGGACIV